MEIQKLVIISEKNETHVYINDKEIKNLKGVEFSHEVGTLPTLQLSVNVIDSERSSNE